MSECICYSLISIVGVFIHRGLSFFCAYVDFNPIRIIYRSPKEDFLHRHTPFIIYSRYNSEWVKVGCAALWWFCHQALSWNISYILLFYSHHSWVIDNIQTKLCASIYIYFILKVNLKYWKIFNANTVFFKFFYNKFEQHIYIHFKNCILTCIYFVKNE